MGNTIYASFVDPSLAEKAAGALLDHGVRAEDISVVQSHEGAVESTNYGTETRTNIGSARSDGDNDLKNAGDGVVGEGHAAAHKVAEWGDRAVGGIAGAVGAEGTAARYDSAADQQRAKAGYDAHAAGREFNDAVDMPNTGSPYTTSHSMGTDRDSDIKNAGDAAVGETHAAGHKLAEGGDRLVGGIAGAVGAEGTAANYDAAANRQEMKAGIDAASARGQWDEASSDRPAIYTTSYAGDYPNDPNATANTTGSVTYPDRVDSAGDTEGAAKHGISTTTAADAGSGAKTGAAWGVGLGAVAAIASLLVPGFGWVVGGGALATALAGVAASAGAGAVAGAVTGYLKDQGVEEHIAAHYDNTITGGGALLAVTVPSGNVSETDARRILDKYGATNINAYESRGYLA
ncbi:hypothetical protein [Fimbriimonas ginsengisoli]|uniref:Uncharacterized protein n=1 Tax=Fimbriimonas ginsengisoli Gsoil 348 TaxID=661478 RepID=A0A068NV70_FIMGI|nr:hypothetical protein [Fimbriimonas ginsengisoli]AIE87267.1 hypothetical protein OP10G_3899 [Fimbriimonas ginsengisoli Gsoil 348]